MSVPAAEIVLTPYCEDVVDESDIDAWRADKVAEAKMDLLQDKRVAPVFWFLAPSSIFSDSEGEDTTVEGEMPLSSLLSSGVQISSCLTDIMGQFNVFAGMVITEININYDDGAFDSEAVTFIFSARGRPSEVWTIRFCRDDGEIVFGETEILREPLREPWVSKRRN